MDLNEALQFCVDYGVTIEFSNLNTKWAKNRPVQVYLEPANREPAITIVWTSYSGSYAHTGTI